MYNLEMVKCPSCKQDYPLKRKELGYTCCINCSTEKPKVAISTINGEGDHTWNDILLMEQDTVNNITRREKEIKNKKINTNSIEYIDFNQDENTYENTDKIRNLIQFGEPESDTDEESAEEEDSTIDIDN